jgi:hypothetical protein
MEYSNRIGDYSKKIADISRVQQNRIWPLPRFKTKGEGLVVLERSLIYKSIRILAIATEYTQSGNGNFFWRTLHHKGKISPAW